MAIGPQVNMDFTKFFADMKLPGELVYTQGGTRKSCGARSDDGSAIEKGSEVVVTGYERGIATVRRWADLASGQ